MSGRKNKLAPYKISSAASLGANFTSKVTSINWVDNVAIQAIWSGGGAPVGAFNVEVSNDYSQDENGNVLRAGTWVAITLNPGASVSGNSGSIFIDLNQLASQWIRVSYVRTSGTGLVDLWLSAKML